MKMSIDEIRKEVEKRLSPERLAHTKRTVEIAVYIAGELGEDPVKAETAGLLIDIAADLSFEEMMEQAEKYDVYISKYNRNFIPSIHGKIGAAIAEQEFGVEDRQVLLAIKNHMSGRPCMKLLEVIIFAADYLAEVQVDDEDLYNSYYGLTMEQALYKYMMLKIKSHAYNGQQMDERTVQTFDWLIERITQKHVKKFEEHPQKVYEEYDALLDRAIQVYREKMIRLKSVKNLRELGGYKTKDGKTIKKKMILRSGALSSISDEDKKILGSIGPNYIIDLRSVYESTSKPDLEVPKMTYINMPLSVMDPENYADKIAEWQKECDDEEEDAWLTVQYYGAIDMDKMYRTILHNPNTKKVINDILRLMISDECTGILFHCTSGKDRTGITAWYILKLLGVSNNTIIDDYLASQVPFVAKMEDTVMDIWINEYSLKAAERTISAESVEQDMPKFIKREMMKDYPNERILLKEFFDLSEEELKKLKDKYLTADEE